MQTINTKHLLIAEKYLGQILFAIMFVIALFTFDEYGITWDSEIQRKTGTINYNYVFNDSTNLLTWKDRDYGVAFELPLIMVERALNLQDTRDVFTSRALLTHLLFLLGAFFCFKLVDFLYKNKLLATIGFLLIVLHPRLYGHSFFNTKDIPFMSMFMISLYMTAITFDKKTIHNAILLGISIGLLINLRIMGVLLPCCIFFFWVVDVFVEKKYLHHLKIGSVFLLTSLLVLYITWPFLWLDPIGNFIEAFENMSKFRWNGIVLFKGEWIKAIDLPLDYIPVWFSLTTPVPYILVGAGSTILLAVHFFKRPLYFLSNVKDRNNLFFLACCYAPVLAILVLHSVLYDGWRQMYFIYPSFVMLAIYGLNFLYEKSKTKIKKKLFIGGSVLIFGVVAAIIISLFPLQHIYFNTWMHRDNEYVRKHFEMDYWGVSYRESLEYILENDKSERIDIMTNSYPGFCNHLLLPLEQRQRLHYVYTKEEATYFITNYRWNWEHKRRKDSTFHSLEVWGSTVVEAFKLR